MKFIVMMALVFAAANSQALNKKNTWNEIFRSGKASFVFDANLGGIALNNACLTPQEVRSIKDMRYCPELTSAKAGQNKDKYTDWVCKEWKIGPYWYPRTTEKVVCSNMVLRGEVYDCNQTTIVKVTVPEQVPVRVEFMEGDNIQSFVKTFVFPNCK